MKPSDADSSKDTGQAKKKKSSKKKRKTVFDDGQAVRPKTGKSRAGSARSRKKSHSGDGNSDIDLRGVSVGFLKELRDKVAAKKSWLHEQAKKHGFDTVSTATVCESICALETEVRSLSGLCRTVLCSRHCYGLVQAVWHRGRVPMVSMQIAAHAVVVSARRPGSTDARGM